MQRVFHPVAVHFKGSGFYNTDYGTAKRKRETDKAATAGADKHDAKAGEKKESKADSKPAASSSVRLTHKRARYAAPAESSFPLGPARCHTASP